MFIVIMGCGRAGSELANRLSVEGYDVSVIDRNPEAFNRLRSDFNGRKVLGTSLDKEVLEKAGIKQADAFVAVSRGDNHNIVTAMIAKDIYHVPRVIARIYDQERAKMYWKMGLTTVAPVIWAANKIHDFLFHFELKERVSFGNAEVEMFEIECPVHLAGRTVSDINIPQEVMVGAIVRNGKAFLPTQGTHFEEEDIIEVLVSAQSVAKFEEIVKG